MFSSLLMLSFSLAWAQDEPPSAEDELWFARFSSAEARFAELIHAWDVRQQLSPPADTALREARAELAIRSSRHRFLQGEQAKLRERLQALPAAVETYAAETDEAAQGLAQTPKEAQALAQLLGEARQSAAMTEDAGSMEKIGSQLTRLRTAIPRDDLEQTHQFEAFEQALYREYGIRQEALQLQALREQLTALDAQVEAAAWETAQAREVLVHVEQASAVPGAPTSAAASIDAEYAWLEQSASEVTASISAERWCRLLVHGGVARILAGGAGGTELLQDAAGAWGGACRAQVVPLLDLEPVQAAWGEALYTSALEGSVTLVLEQGGARWWVDGQEVSGYGQPLLVVGPGVHRLAYMSADDQEDVHIERLAGGSRIFVYRERGEIALTPVDAGGEVWVRPTPSFSDGEVLVAAGEDRAPLQVGLSSLWLRLDGRSHIGARLSGTWALRQGERAGFGLRMSHDTAMGSNAYALSGSLSSRWIHRERIGAYAQFALGPVWAGPELAVGWIPPAVAPVTDLALSARAPLGERLEVDASAGVGATWWKGGAPQLDPAFTLGLGLKL